MIIWLASFPRSGNTLLRQILRQVFEKETYSESNDAKDLGIHPAGRDIVGHQNYSESWDKFYAGACRRGDLCFVKTHKPPLDAGKVIYVVRDGRSATVSFCHFLRQYRGKTNVDLPMTIRGEGHRMGCWSSHLDSWQPLQRTDCLLLRFENLRANTNDCISRIAEFTGLGEKRDWVNPLSKLRSVMPGFVRGGCDETNISELADDDEKLFWRLHGTWMSKLGYNKNA